LLNIFSLAAEHLNCISFHLLSDEQKDFSSSQTLKNKSTTDTGSGGNLQQEQPSSSYQQMNCIDSVIR
jgi:period circadian protein